MLTLLLRTNEYKFIQNSGTDHLEGHQYAMDSLLGKGVVHFSNKRGGIMFMFFVGQLSMTKKADIILKIEEECGLKYIGEQDTFYKPEYEKNLRSVYGEKLVIE